MMNKERVFLLDDEDFIKQMDADGAEIISDTLHQLSLAAFLKYEGGITIEQADDLVHEVTIESLRKIESKWGQEYRERWGCNLFSDPNSASAQLAYFIKERVANSVICISNISGRTGAEA